TLAVGGTPVPQAGWVANVKISGSGAQQVETALVGSRLDVLTGAWWQAHPHLRLGADANFMWGLADRIDVSNVSTLTANVFAQVATHDDVSLIIGGGTGLGIGAPAYRLFAGITWAPGAMKPKPPPDPCAIP